MKTLPLTAVLRGLRERNVPRFSVSSLSMVGRETKVATNSWEKSGRPSTETLLKRAIYFPCSNLGGMSALLVDVIPLCTGFELCWHLAWFHFEKITGAFGAEPCR